VSYGIGLEIYRDGKRRNRYLVWLTKDGRMVPGSKKGLPFPLTFFIWRQDYNLTNEVVNKLTNELDSHLPQAQISRPATMQPLSL